MIRGQLDRSTAFLDYIFDLLVKRGQSVENVERLQRRIAKASETFVL